MTSFAELVSVEFLCVECFPVGFSVIRILENKIIYILLGAGGLMIYRFTTMFSVKFEKVFLMKPRMLLAFLGFAAKCLSKFSSSSSSTPRSFSVLTFFSVSQLIRSIRLESGWLLAE